LKTTLIFALHGALAGIVVASFVVPPALSWYSEPGGLPRGAQIPAVVQIPEVIRYATTTLMRWQAIAAGIGGVVGVVLGIGVARRGRQRVMGE
jgi:ABC-type antimicrobial peptide transport system permease subunit